MVSTKNRNLYHSLHSQGEDKSDWLRVKSILCACSENRTRPEVVILGADQN